MRRSYQGATGSTLWRTVYTVMAVDAIIKMVVMVIVSRKTCAGSKKSMVGDLKFHEFHEFHGLHGVHVEQRSIGTKEQRSI
jgi:hypothetical protein